MAPDLRGLWLEIKGLASSRSAGLDLGQVSILDLGCGCSDEIFRFYEDARFSRYVGVELEMACSMPVTFSRYSSFLNEGELNGPDLTESDFDETFSMLYGTDLEIFIAECTEKFDIVVLSNLLHLRTVKEQWRDLLKSSMSCLKPGGFAYVKVFIKEWDDSIIHFEDSEIQELTAMFACPVLELEEVSGVKKLRVFGQRAS